MYPPATIFPTYHFNNQVVEPGKIEEKEANTPKRSSEGGACDCVFACLILPPVTRWLDIDGVSRQTIDTGEVWICVVWAFRREQKKAKERERVCVLGSRR
jgi:hypothetical protein